MRALMLCALLTLVPAAAATAGSSAAQAHSQAQGQVQSWPASSAASLGLGQTWVLEGRTDQGRRFRSELRLEQVPADERAGMEQGFRQTAGAASISALFAGTPRTGEQAHLLMVSRAAEQDMVVVMPNPSAEDPETTLGDDLTFCFLLPDPGARSFSGLSLRLREEGETYTVTGTVSDQGSGREQVLNTLRGMYTPMFGVGECKLTRR